MQIDFLLSTEQEKLNGCHTGPRTLHLGMQHEKILAHLKMDIAYHLSWICEGKYFNPVYQDCEEMLSLRMWRVASLQMDGLRAEQQWDDDLD